MPALEKGKKKVKTFYIYFVDEINLEGVIALICMV